MSENGREREIVQEDAGVDKGIGDGWRVERMVGWRRGGRAYPNLFSTKRGAYSIDDLYYYYYYYYAHYPLTVLPYVIPLRVPYPCLPACLPAIPSSRP